ncbi:MAG: NAD(P)H-dependent oxidoreductase [Promethearchaeota archaeon]
MKIIVLVGSPKGDRSITKHYVLYLQKKFPNHEFVFFNVAQRIKKLEKSKEAFQEIMNEISSSDAIIWAFPLYFCLVHANYKRFIELIFERKEAVNAFRGKYAFAISTSIHFYDHTAHNYIHGISDDLEMHYFGRYSAGMNDIMNDDKRENFLNYASLFFDSVEKKVPTSRRYPKIIHQNFDYMPGESKINEKIDLKGKKVLIVSDVEKGIDSSLNLQKMITKFKDSFSDSDEIEEVNLRDLNIKGSCLGCLQCAYDNQCSYRGKDDFIEFYDSKVKKADILIYAGAIKDRYLSSRFKMLFDRSFYNTHIPVLMGKQIGFIISGPLSQIPNLRETFQGWNETNKLNTVDFITDESQNSEEIDGLLQALALKSINFSEIGFVNELTMRGVAGKNIFRDDIWGGLRYPFRADYKFYKKHGFFDFPQKKRKSIFISKLMLFLSLSKGFRQGANKYMATGMAGPIKKMIEEM